MGTLVLLIEDDDVVRKITEHMLLAAGYDVICAADGRQGLVLFDLLRPDLVITDIVMPERDGIEVILHIRQYAPSTGVVAISGGFWGNMDVLSYAAKLGADRVLAKPFRGDDLLAAANEALISAGRHQ